MKIALLQTDLIWENSIKNREMIEGKIHKLNHDIDLLVLPEMFSTGFTMNASNVVETMQGETVNWLKQIAEVRNCAVTGSVAIEENHKFYNRMLFVFPSGEIQYYDKRHLFSLAGEQEIYTAGVEKKIVTYKDWKICLQICYDLRFPVFARNVEQYDLLLYVANWPSSRILAWDSLLRARAIENLSYVIGVNRVGFDGNNLEYNGHSQVLDALGNYIVPPLNKEAVSICELDKNSLLQNREKFNFLGDQDQFTISN